jgi:transposase-like protein
MQLAASTNLSPVQAQVIAALAQGRTITTAAVEAGIHRNTIYNWLRELHFKTAVEEAQREYAAILADGMRDLASRARISQPRLALAGAHRAAARAAVRRWLRRNGSQLPRHAHDGRHRSQCAP